MALGRERASTNSIVALVLGIVSFFGLGILAGLPAWIIGSNELKKIDAGAAPADGATMARIGMVLGIITTVLTIVGLVIFFTMAGGMLHFATH